MRVLDLLVDREVELTAAFGLDLGLVMGSSEVRATPSAAPPQPRRANHPAGRDPMGRLGRTPAGTATLRSRTKASHFCANSRWRGQNPALYRRFESHSLRHIRLNSNYVSDFEPTPKSGHFLLSSRHEIQRADQLIQVDPMRVVQRISGRAKRTSLRSGNVQELKSSFGRGALKQPAAVYWRRSRGVLCVSSLQSQRISGRGFEPLLRYQERNRRKTTAFTWITQAVLSTRQACGPSTQVPRRR